MRASDSPKHSSNARTRANAARMDGGIRGCHSPPASERRPQSPRSARLACPRGRQKGGRGRADEQMQRSVTHDGSHFRSARTARRVVVDDLGVDAEIDDPPTKPKVPPSHQSTRRSVSNRAARSGPWPHDFAASNDRWALANRLVSTPTLVPYSRMASRFSAPAPSPSPAPS
jgi:hypothetical protein